MSYASFVHFATCFNLHPGIADDRHSTERTLTHSDIATIFFASVAVERVDSVGGLTFEEWNEALVRVAMAYDALKGGVASSLLQVAESGTYSFRSAEDKLFNLFRHMARALPRTVPRFVNGPVMSGAPGRPARGSKESIGPRPRLDCRSREILMKGPSSS